MFALFPWSSKMFVIVPHICLLVLPPIHSWKKSLSNCLFLLLGICSCYTSSAAGSVISSVSAASAIVTTSLVCWRPSWRWMKYLLQALRYLHGSYGWLGYKQCCTHRKISLHRLWTALDWKDLEWTLWLSLSSWAFMQTLTFYCRQAIYEKLMTIAGISFNTDNLA